MPTFKTIAKIVGYVEVTCEARDEQQARGKFREADDEDIEYDILDLEVEEVKPDWAGVIDKLKNA